MVVVTGIGLLSSLGTSLEHSWQELMANKSGIQWHQPFSELEAYPLGLIGTQPAELEILTQLVVSAALKDAGLVPPLPDCAVVIGSSRSHQGYWELLSRKMYGNNILQAAVHSKKVVIENWLDFLPHMIAMAAARQIGTSGIVLAPMAACATGIWAMAQATLLIETGQCQRVIAGGIEAPITPLTLSGFQKMGALAKTGAYPFDLHRQGLVLGEGAAVFVLESPELAKQRQAKIYGSILGFGLTTDAFHGNKPECTAKSAIAAVQQCLQRSSLRPSDIDYIHAHGTATELNDRIENKIIQNIFPKEVAVSSTKGATGHTLGASGALGVAFSLLAMQKKILPPCVGLKSPEFDLNLVMEPRESQLQNVLCFSFGFGGQNAIIALSNKTESNLGVEITQK
ncbi:beta-ketoacyl-ACP synthase [Umezakia ovalisporum]|uniref:Beta-ketoacyl-ACP synthase n=2 Tax=Umezakia ovalisporum TaxID=75695 RepID=A0AA43GZ63_9CYAN|nr:beta-ketoacyl-ACP synthase [Umezakia ovalisporum]MDH6056372.1 beta-ketoacyl-ACP synthase [Umezakia ovalisporum FSS-43]MDH6063905.1 beta-ketoacyl-ACP synthase [Umezakia ovalisporum FSS-62]MDH6069165.1 beta-ketoacyl-ACP synthase [Umezakia ovalisporum APH033B]MDH6070086.1 beta-ketoacyl-ACP synthase [Umezakia ovalisporum CobakiLakeA]MDH6073198.1 beta-ketoacyl-ACP synthase [Umezakia ovalisporum CS-1034]